MSIDQKSYYENNKVKLLLKQKERYEKHIKYKTNFESTQNQICKTCMSYIGNLEKGNKI